MAWWGKSCCNKGKEKNRVLSIRFINQFLFLVFMGFVKSFPKTTDKTIYPKWEEVSLTEAEEKLEEEKARNENIKIIKECIEDAKAIIKEKNLKPYQTDIINLAISLFEKRASHLVYWKEEKAKEKFDEKYKK